MTKQFPSPRFVTAIKAPHAMLVGELHEAHVANQVKAESIIVMSNKKAICNENRMKPQTWKRGATKAPSAVSHSKNIIDEKQAGEPRAVESCSRQFNSL